MLNFLYEFLPIVLFFIAFKFYGIYVATVVGIVATALQLILTTLIKRSLDKKQLFTLVIFILFGGLTLYFHNPLFVKWKPTVMFWAFGLVFFGSHFFGKKTIIERMVGHALEGKVLPHKIWIKLNFAWTLFFIGLGCLNLYVAYHFSTDAWVNFKLYGVLGLLFFFTVAQSIYLARYLSDTK